MTSATPSVLFVCVHNAGRSQMAAGFLTALGGDAVTVQSAGSDPASQVNTAAVAAMTEVGIDISTQVPKRLTFDAVDAANLVITMGCGDACPVISGVEYRDWQLPDPAGQGIAAVRAIRNEIESKIHALLDELALPTS